MAIKQQRKKYSGAKHDRERTMNKMIISVGKVLEEKGYTGLTVSNISKCAGVDRKLVTMYFGSVEKLIEAYFMGKDYWSPATIGAMEFFGNTQKSGSRELLESLLLTQLILLQKNRELQNIVAWQISERSELMAHVAREREKMLALFFTFADREHREKDLDLRAISAILLSGINYLVLHSVNTNSTICEIDVSTKEGMDRIRAAVSKILEWTYSAR